MTATAYRQVKKRHPWRGLFFGFVFGVGLLMMAILMGWYWLGQYTPWILLVLGIVLGFLISYLPRPWGKKQPPEPTPMATATTMPPPPPPVEAPPPAGAASAVESAPDPDPETYAPPRDEPEP